MQGTDGLNINVNITNDLATRVQNIQLIEAVSKLDLNSFCDLFKKEARSSLKQRYGEHFRKYAKDSYGSDEMNCFELCAFICATTQNPGAKLYFEVGMMLGFYQLTKNADLSRQLISANGVAITAFRQKFPNMTTDPDLQLLFSKITGI